MHGGPRWACLLCNLIYIHSSVSKMEAVLLTQATEEQRNPHKERSYLASRSEHHWRWCAGLFNVEICRREREKERKRERHWPDRHLDAGACGEEAVLSELFRAHITAP